MKKKREQVGESRYLTLTQAGVYYGGRSPDAMRMMLRRGRLAYIKVGRRTLIDRHDIDRMMERGKSVAG
jgi:excisionase family DNA binding protein